MACRLESVLRTAWCFNRSGGILSGFQSDLVAIMTTTTLEQAYEEAAKADGPKRCKDFDEDCFGLDHLHCWLYDPAKGYCPFLSDKP